MTSDTEYRTKENNINKFLISEETENKIDTRIDQKFIIMIKSNLTTGYSWLPENTKGNKFFKFLGFNEKDCFDKKEGLRGEPSFECFVFKALKPGQTQITLNYSRPWEKDKKPLKTVKIKLIIQ